MRIFNLLRFWKRPRTESEFETWRMLELQMNAHLLGPHEGPLPHLFLTKKAASLYEKPDWRERAAAPDMFETYSNKYVVAPLVAASMLITLPLAGTADAVYELFRLFASVAIKMRRPSYYNAEAKRRAERFARQRSNAHRIRHRSSWLLPPSPCELLDAWDKAHHRGAVKEKLRLGAMMSVIEAAVDNGLLRNLDGEIVGRKSGVKGWLMQHCGALAPHYSTLMRYKAAADKLAIASGLSDPCPEEVLLTEKKTNTDNAITVGTNGCPICRWSEKEQNGIVRGISEKVNRIIAITVGTKRPMTMKLTLRGVKEGVTKELVEKRMQYVSGCRHHARTLWEEAARTGVLHSFRSLDDFLYARLGLIRERRLFGSDGEPVGSQRAPHAAPE